MHKEAGGRTDEGEICKSFDFLSKGVCVWSDEKKGGTRGPSEKAKSIFFECAMIKVGVCGWLRF